LEKSNFSSDYLRILNDFPPLVAVAAGGRNEQHTVFRRCGAPEKKRAVRTVGSNSGELKAGKKVKKRRKNEQKAEKLNKKRKNDSFYCVNL